ncbi:MAG TPA: MFS transporter [Candidatus Saccharimonadales bacterium]|nr:MFS transporter [Candidatus Saccharimonadales bacterium]
MKTSSKWLVFTLVAVAQFMVVLDNAITNVALPTIKQQLHFSSSALQWVVTAYALFFGGFLLLGGRTADLFGRRRTLLTGMAAFTGFSLLIGLSQTPAQLIILRALQGLSGAFMSPAALSIVLVTFRDGPSRNRALSFWTLVATGGAALGLLLGGALTEYFGWRWNFFINIPIGLSMLALIRRYVPVHENEEKQKGLDVPGAILATSSLMLLVLTFSQAPVWGWTSLATLGTLGAAIALLAGFIANEARARRPLMPLSIFKVRNVRGANMIMAPLYAAMLGSFFLLTLYLQGVLHFSPVLTGLSFLPFPLTLALMSSRMPKLVARYGFRRFLIVGPLVVALGLLWVSLLHVGSSYWLGILPAAILMPVGIGMTMMPTIAAATSGVPAHEAGIASGLISTSQQMGGALGLSVLSGIATSVAAHWVHAGSAQAAVHGSRMAFLAAAGLMALASLVAVVVIRTPKRVTADKSPEDESFRARSLQSSVNH